MMNTITYPGRPLENLRVALLPASILVLFLFYIDEGWYSFRWMLDWGNWIVFAIYLLLFVPVFWLISRFMFKSQRGVKKLTLVSLVGIPLTLLVFFALTS